MTEETVSAADANRKLSRLLRGVREARTTYVVTSHGRPVARIVPIERHDDVTRATAREALIARLRSQPVVDIGHWTRDELYDDAP